MREQIGILLMEERSGEIAVQIFADVKGVETVFENLSGSPADLPKRATLISLKYGEGGIVEVRAKDLPVIKDLADQPDGYLLGEGPVRFKKVE